MKIRPPLVTWLLLGLTTIGTILVISWPLYYSTYGLDFSDEGYHLNWISNPFKYNISITQFGYVYHPLYIWLSGNISLLRQLNILITYTLGWGLCYTALRKLDDSFSSRLVRLVASAGAATSTLIIFDSWLVTPSYNSLAFQALILACIGLILADANCSRKSLVGWVMLSVGGWFVFLAKPSTAAALSVSAIIYLLITRKFKFHLLSIVVILTAALFCISALLIDGTISEFIARFRLGYKYTQLLGAGHNLDTMLRQDPLAIDTNLRTGIAIITLTSFIASLGFQPNSPLQRVAFLCILATFSITVLIVAGAAQPYIYLGQLPVLLSSSICFAGALLYVYSFLKKYNLNTPCSIVAMVILFVSVPYIYAFGTSNNYWLVGGSAAFFWILSGLVLVAPLAQRWGTWQPVLPLVIATQAITVTMLQKGLEKPYRQEQPLRLNSAIVELGNPISSLVLSDDYATYISNVLERSRSSGFRVDTPMIDLTGQSPGISYALSAENLGHPWIIGGYPGSVALAMAYLESEPCEKIAKAWLLYEADGPRSVSPEVLHRFGAHFPENYRLKARWNTAVGAGGYLAPRSQELYEPVNTLEIFNNCKILRGEASNQASVQPP